MMNSEVADLSGQSVGGDIEELVLQERTLKQICDLKICMMSWNAEEKEFLGLGL